MSWKYAITYLYYPLCRVADSLAASPNKTEKILSQCHLIIQFKVCLTLSIFCKLLCHMTGQAERD